MYLLKMFSMAKLTPENWKDKKKTVLPKTNIVSDHFNISEKVLNLLSNYIGTVFRWANVENQGGKVTEMNEATTATGRQYLREYDERGSNEEALLS